MVEHELPRDPVLLCWFRQSRTEYMAASLTAELTHWILQLGVRPDLLVRATKVVADEVRHSAMCHELYLHLGGTPRQVPLARRSLSHGDDPGHDIALRAITAAAELACEESVALPVFKTRLRNAVDPAVKEVCEIIFRDEATHRGFAWDLLEALIEMQGHETVRAWARPRIAFWLRAYLRARLEDNAQDYRPDQLEKGLINRPEHWTLMRACVSEDVIPRFVSLDLLEPGVTRADLGVELDAYEANLADSRASVAR